MKATNTALVLINLQKGFDQHAYYGGNRNNPQAEQNATKILQKFRELQWPVFHVRHSSTDPNSPLHSSKPGFQIKEDVQPLPHETLITKIVNSAFIGTHLKKELDEAGIQNLIVVGLTTNYCVSTSVRMGSNLGYTVYTVSDATAAFDQTGLNGIHFSSDLVHQATLANLNKEFSTIVNTNQVLQYLS